MFILEDILEASESIQHQAATGKLSYGINVGYTSPTGKRKNLDLAIGHANGPIQNTLIGSAAYSMQRATSLGHVLFSCEAKSVMTEHKKSQPRVYDELSSSHEIVHGALPNAIATGVTVVNAAKTFVSPLRQTTSTTLHVSEHRQPYVAESMVNHLRGLAIRDEVGQVGFDAYATIMIDCDNRTRCELVTDSPAPGLHERDSYANYLARVVRFYEERFGHQA